MGLSNGSERPLPPYAMRTCSGCIHWIPVGNPSLEIQMIKNGQCRRMPPQGQIMNAQQNVSFYPVLPENFGACGMFESLLSYGVEEDEPADPRDAAPRLVK